MFDRVAKANTSLHKKEEVENMRERATSVDGILRGGTGGKRRNAAGRAKE